MRGLVDVLLGGAVGAVGGGELFAPVLEEEAFFLEVEDAVGFADDGAEGGGHLEGDEEEDGAPDDEVSGALHAEGLAGAADEGEAEADAEEPEGGEEEAHEAEGVAGGAEEPDDGGEADEEEGGEGDHAAEEAGHGAEFGVEAAEAGEDVEAGEADEGAEEESADDFEGSGPELGAGGEAADDESEDEEADGGDEDEFPGEGVALFAVLEVVDEGERLFEELVEDVGEGGAPLHGFESGGFGLVGRDTGDAGWVVGHGCVLFIVRLSC